MPISSPLPDPGDPVGPAEAKVDAFLREVRSRLNADTSVVPAPPGDPTDGEVCSILLEPDQGVIGQLRYRSASPSPYKWETISDARVRLDRFGPFVLTSNTLTEVGFGWTCPFAGEYTFRADLGRVAVNSVLPSTVEFGVYVGAPAGTFLVTLGRKPFDGDDDPVPESVPGLEWTMPLVAGDVVHLGARATGNGVTVQTVSGSVRPSRVAG